MKREIKRKNMLAIAVNTLSIFHEKKHGENKNKHYNRKNKSWKIELKDMQRISSKNPE